MPKAWCGRLWRSLKYEEVHLKAYANGLEARIGIGQPLDEDSGAFDATVPPPSKTISFSANIDTHHAGKVAELFTGYMAKK